MEKRSTSKPNQPVLKLNVTGLEPDLSAVAPGRSSAYTQGDSAEERFFAHLHKHSKALLLSPFSKVSYASLPSLLPRLRQKYHPLTTFCRLIRARRSTQAPGKCGFLFFCASCSASSDLPPRSRCARAPRIIKSMFELGTVRFPASLRSSLFCSTSRVCDPNDLPTA